MNIDNVKVFQLNECDAVAAETVKEAQKWYMEITGLSEQEAFYGEEPKEVSLTHEIWQDETRKKKEVLKDVLEELWEGKPFIIFSTEY